MYGCFWCSVQGHLIKGECTPVTGGQCQPVGYFPSEQVTIRKPRRSHACMLLVHSNWQCVCACVYLRKLQLSKTHFVSLAAHFMSYYKYALQYLHEKICRFPNSFFTLHKLNKYCFVCFPLSFCGQSVTPFSLRGWGFIASQWPNPLKALWSLSHWCFNGFMNSNVSHVYYFSPDVQPGRARAREEGVCHCQGFRYGQVSVVDVYNVTTWKSLSVLSSRRISNWQHHLQWS